MSNKNVNIDVHHVTRVEGHGNIRVNITDGNIEKIEWQVVEAPRFFEAMVRGRHYSEVARITSRICGICSVGHTLASVKATEEALGIQITEQADIFRRLVKHGENFDSNILHVLFLAAPDFLGVPSVFPLAETNLEVVKIALRLKKLGSNWASLIGGRSTHPTKVVPGGFSSWVTEEELKGLREDIVNAIPDVLAVKDLLKDLAPNIPDFVRETEYVALVDDVEYGLYDGNIGCLMPDGTREIIEVENYKDVTNEWVSPLSTAKYTKHRMGSYMVGALARFNLNYDMLHEEAKKVAEELGLKPICFNPYMNSVAQFIECVHSAYQGIEFIDTLLERGVKDEELVKPKRFDSNGAGAVDVPRGILFHEYTYDDKGFCVCGNCIIPTNQNHANIQFDFEKLVPEMLDVDKAEKDMELGLEMLVRAYDPCISCSTHYLDVEFVK